MWAPRSSSESWLLVVLTIDSLGGRDLRKVIRRRSHVTLTDAEYGAAVALLR